MRPKIHEVSSPLFLWPLLSSCGKIISTGVHKLTEFCNMIFGLTSWLHKHQNGIHLEHAHIQSNLHCQIANQRSTSYAGRWQQDRTVSSCGHWMGLFLINNSHATNNAFLTRGFGSPLFFSAMVSNGPPYVVLQPCLNDVIVLDIAFSKRFDELHHRMIATKCRCHGHVGLTFYVQSSS